MSVEFNVPFELPNGWRVFTVEELIKRGILEKPLDGNHGGIHPKASDYVEFGVPFIMASDLENGRVNLDSCKFISGKQANTLRKGFAKSGDVLLSHKATIGRTAIVQDNKHDFIVLTPQVTYYRIIDNKLLNNRYLKSYFDSNFFQSILGQWAGAGSTRAYLGITGQQKLPIILPPPVVQEVVAGMVGSLDNKIELNRQINQTLEQIAQTIFKSWFVDYEPVKAKIKAKATGCDPKHAAMCAISGKIEPELDQLSLEQYQQLAATAALFPDELVESELGLIPQGWEVKPLDQIADYLNGLALQKYPPESDREYLPVIKIAQLKKGDTEGADRASSKLKPEYIVNDGDVLFSWSGSLEVDVWCGGQGALNQHLFKVTSNVYPKWIYLYWTKSHLNRFQAIAAAKAVTMGHIQRMHLTESLCVAPPVRSVELFDVLLAPLLYQQVELRKESRKLANFRGTLLPKLLSGEIKINDVANGD